MFSFQQKLQVIPRIKVWLIMQETKQTTEAVPREDQTLALLDKRH